MKYRKKPTIVDAFKWTGEKYIKEGPLWLMEALKKLVRTIGSVGIYGDESGFLMTITHKGGNILFVDPGDYIILDHNGDIFPVNAENFEATYELVEEDNDKVAD